MVKHSDLTEIHGKDPNCFSKAVLNYLLIPSDKLQLTAMTLIGTINIKSPKEKIFHDIYIFIE